MLKKGIAVAAFVIVAVVFFLGFLSYNKQLRSDLNKDIEVSIEDPMVEEPEEPVVEDPDEGEKETLEMPDLIGRSEEEVLGILASLGLNGVRYEEYTDGVEQGLIFDQRPLKGAELSPEIEVNYTVSLGPFGASEEAVMVSVPNLSGKTEGEARVLLQEVGLLMQVEKAYSSTISKDSVISQGILAGREVAEGSTIKVVISLGQELIEVPNVIGRTLQEGQSMLERLSFVVSITREHSQEPEGRILRQSARGGTNLTKGQTVTLTVSRGPAPVEEPVEEKVTVPSVAGMMEANAKKTLEDVGLVVRVNYEENDKEKGTVLTQSIATNQKVDKGSTITLTVSTGPMAIVPNIRVGESEKGAIDILTALGFKVEVRKIRDFPSIDPDRFLGMNQTVGAKIPYGSTIIIDVTYPALEENP